MMNHLIGLYRRTTRTLLPALMLAVFMMGIAISDFHSHRDCRDADRCAMCTFQTSTCALADDSSSEFDPADRPILHSILISTERAGEPFHISVFPNHAPPFFS